MEDTGMDHPDALHAEKQGMRTGIGDIEALTPEPVEGMIGDPAIQDPEHGVSEDKSTIMVG